MSWHSSKSLSECSHSDKHPKWLLPPGWLSQAPKKQHNRASSVNLLQCVWLSPPHWSSVFLCGFPAHLLWKDGVSEPHLLQHFSYQAFPFQPCSQTTYKHLVTFLFSYCSLPHRASFSLCWASGMFLPKASFSSWPWQLLLCMLASFPSGLQGVLVSWSWRSVVQLFLLNLTFFSLPL